MGTILHIWGLKISRAPIFENVEVLLTLKIYPYFYTKEEYSRCELFQAISHALINTTSYNAPTQKQVWQHKAALM